MTTGVRHTSAPPFNRWGVRLGNASESPPLTRGAYEIPVNSETSYARAPGDLNDGAISRERMPWYHQGYYAAPDFLVNWTESGPIRPSLHMRDVTIRTMAGTSNTRAQDPTPTGLGIQDGNGSLPGGIRQLNSAGIEVPQNYTPHGLHTRVRGSSAQSTRRHFSGAAQTRAGRQNRLANSTGQGQSFSATTVHQGGGRLR